eukprot:scaffold4096_cov88-Isochrysis_galbana.AAC.3
MDAGSRADRRRVATLDNARHGRDGRPAGAGAGSAAGPHLRLDRGQRLTLYGTEEPACNRWREEGKSRSQIGGERSPGRGGRHARRRTAARGAPAALPGDWGRQMVLRWLSKATFGVNSSKVSLSGVNGLTWEGRDRSTASTSGIVVKAERSTFSATSVCTVGSHTK